MTRYAEAADLAALGVRSQATGGIASGDIDDALDAASVLFDGYARSRYDVPFTTWGMDVTAAVAKVAAYEILSTRGLSPAASDSDQNVRDRYRDAIAWMKDVAAGRARVSGGATTPTAERHARASTAPTVRSTGQRGW
jgi:phage gp36-like protein